MTLHGPGGLPPWVWVEDKDTGYQYAVRYPQPGVHEVLKGESALGDDGNPRPPIHDTEAAKAKAGPSAEDLKGQELDDALEAAGLPKSGTAGEKRQRLAEHQANTGQEG